MNVRVVRVSQAIIVVALLATPAAAQQPDFSKIEVKATKVSGNVYALEGSGGTIGVLVGPDGVFMVDSQFAPLTEKIVAAIKQINQGPIRFLINTHQHPDHTGGNENFAKLGVNVLSRDELRARLSRPNAQGASPSMASLPLMTYRGVLTFHMNNETIHASPLNNAHTDGDTVVHFQAADVLMTGDIFRSLGYPNIDRNNGGSLNGMIEAFNRMIQMCGPDTKVVPGHGAITDKSGLQAQLSVLTGVRDKVSAALKEGKDLKAILAAKPTAEFDAKVPSADTTSERFVTQVYGELGGK